MCKCKIPLKLHIYTKSQVLLAKGKGKCHFLPASKDNAAQHKAITVCTVEYTIPLQKIYTETPCTVFQTFKARRHWESSTLTSVGTNWYCSSPCAKNAGSGACITVRLVQLLNLPAEKAVTLSQKLACHPLSSIGALSALSYCTPTPAKPQHY